jgi:hypothetical protein
MKKDDRNIKDCFITLAASKMRQQLFAAILVLWQLLASVASATGSFQN